jgi:CPA2 family monovalent cation:H+ antiporter-2
MPVSDRHAAGNGRVIQALYVLLAYLLFAFLFERLRVGSIVGLLIAGAAIGPWGAGLFHDVATISVLAELGILFLLFNLGLEIKVDRIRLFGIRVYLLAVLQVVATSVAIAMLAQGFGLSIEASIIVGAALALSSTALVLQILSDLGRTVTQLGRLAVATLLIQDIAVGPLLVAANLLGEGSGIGGAIVTFVFGAAVSVTVVIAVSRFALPPLLRQVAALGAPELFMAMTLFVVLASSWATEHAGLSAALGAFLSGLMLADTEYRHQIAADLAPFRGLFLGLFFMTVGMKADLGTASSHWMAIVGVTIGLIAIKGALLIVIAIALRYPLRIAIELAVLLSQGSEFSFIVLGLAAASGLVAGPAGAILTVSVVLSMMVTATAAASARRYLDRSEGEARSPLAELQSETESVRGHVLVLGFGQVGMALTRHLVGLDIPVLVLDYDPRRVRAARARNIPIFFGNVSRSDVLRAAHIDQANLVVVALPDPDAAVEVASLAHRLVPSVRILARAPVEKSVDELLDAGAIAVVPESLTTALDLAERSVLLYQAAAAPDSPKDPENSTEKDPEKMTSDENV